MQQQEFVSLPSASEDAKPISRPPAEGVIE
jgi:hypothetical protein